MTYANAISILKNRFGEQLSTRMADREGHGKDEGGHAPMLPDAVLRASTKNEVADAVRLCARYRMPVIPFGAGTSLEGHICAVHGGLSIDLSGMNRILALNETDQDVRVEAGVTRQTLNTHLRDKGLFFPVDPGSECTLGGMAATRASGTNAVRYGTMREQVLSLEVVTADGELIETGSRARKSAAGLDLTHLYIGSEGTLGIITELSLKLHGIPEKLAAGVCRFPNLGAATDTVMATIQMGIPVSRIELLDELSIRAVNQHAGTSHLEAPTLFLEFGGTAAGVDEQIATFTDLALACGGSHIAFADNQEDINRMWHARHQLYYATRAMAPGKQVVTTDVCVPISRLGDCMAETRADFEKSPVMATMLGHVGDGNFHTIMLADPESATEISAMEWLNERMVRRAIDMGGTCTGEHGIGLGKRTFLAWEKGPALTLMRQVKTALDPHGIMNPGKMLPDR
ncbi:FAD-binding oxidoreductase [Kordiimonas aestuarii]|uniref:FAD-binding oxidoreductase n=1 Tax=Kordiimonas aestuarii TaxID=1005925 RepID=UPI0021D25261|nr:FAD-linked oxidase C-terminal domain-containing protein [Kordiimonas aestuarii]